MTDLTKFLPAESPIVEAIYAKYKEIGDAEPSRGYLGASMIGSNCSRYLWYTFRGCTRESFSGRLYRLFERGDLEEIRMVKDLRDIGCTIRDVDPNTGEQFEISDVAGHFSGHMDGCGLGIPTAPESWHVLEFKTAKGKLFKILEEKGVRVAYPKHYAQMQVYMHKTGMKRALYMCVNKDTEELYAERVYYDKDFAEALVAKARWIIFLKEPPARITERRDWYECKFCSAYDLCWASGEVALPVPTISCRQCCHSTPTEDGHGRWICAKHDRGLSWKDQQAACCDHLILPGLLSFAQPTGYGKTPNPSPSMMDFEYIEFTNNDGSKWNHGQANGHFCTRELQVIPISALVSPMLTATKELFSAEATQSFTDDILSRYPPSDSEMVYRGRVDGLGVAWMERYGHEITACEIMKEVDTGDYKAIEFVGGRVAVIHRDRVLHPAEIRQGKE